MLEKLVNLSTKDKFYNFIFLITIFYLTANYYDGFLGYFRKIFGFKLLLILLILVLIIIVKEKGIKYLVNINNIIIIFLAILGVIPSLFFQAEYVYYIMGYFLFQCAVIYNISRFLKDYNDPSINKLIASFLIIEFVFSMLVSNFYNLEYESNIFREACADLLEVIANRCGKSFIFCLMGPGKVFSTPMLLMLSIYKAKQNKAWILVTIISLFTVINSDFLNTYICLLITLIIWVLSMLKKKLGNLKTIILTFLLLVSIFIVAILLYKNQFMTPSVYSKFNLLLNFENYKSLNYYLQKTQEWIEKGGRVDYYVSGIDERIISYLKPFVGLWLNRFLYNPFRPVASCDCTMLEYLSFYGILFVPLLYVIKNVIVLEFTNVTIKPMHLCAAKYIYIYIMLQSILSKVSYTDIPIMIFIIVPFILGYKKKEKEYE